MADISVLSRLINGVQRNVTIASNELVTNSVKVGGSVSNTELTKTILDKLILINTAADADGTFDLQYADIAIEAVANAALPSASFTDAAVTGKLLTGYSSSAGLVAAGDTLLVGINKLNGNSVGIKATADAALPSASFTDAAVTGKLLTGYSSSTGAISTSDTVLQAIGKLNGNLGSAIVGAIIYKSTFDANAAAPAVKASLVTQGLTLTAKTAGVGGNAYRFTVVDVGTGLSYTEPAGIIEVDLGGTTPTTVQVVTLLAGSAFVDVVESTPGSVIAASILPFTGGLAAVGAFDAINNPKQGWLYKVSVAGTIDGRLYSVNDNMYLNKDVVGHPVNADIDLIDNTEAADLLRKGGLTSGQIFVGSAGNEATAVSMSSEATMVASGAVTLSNAAVIGKVLTGWSQGAGTIAAGDSILAGLQKADGNAAAAQGTANAALPSASFTNAAVTGKIITGYSSSAGVVADTDSILVAINKLNGNIANAQAGSNSTLKVMVAGQSFSINTTYAVRMAMSGETAGRVYEADWDASSLDKFYAIGFITPTASISAGDNVTVTLVGEHAIGASDTAFAVGEIGQAVHIKAAGAWDAVSQISYTSGKASYRVGVVQTTTKILVGNMQINGVE